MASRIIAIVPARGGSKGIPDKNVMPVGGKPLVAWTIQAALASGVVDRVIVSTDEERIAGIARAAGAETPFIRPGHIARDEVHAVHVILHALDWLLKHEGTEPEGVLMLLPTSPLRKPEDIRGVVRMFDKHRADAVVSVVDLGKYMTNLRYLNGNGEPLERVAPDEDRNAQRQGLRGLFAVNGSIFMARPDVLRREGSFHVEGALGYVMDPLSSIDINSLDDLTLAREIHAFRQQQHNGNLA
ncbi:cytidylyltransferase domain-containing protein [Corticimicrobacter populi]|uniref:Acylneuraminate cytidylyltransferase n=1 Tax=Corticimicrobacter populi TaxID=2175229 RepID=A0A2V1JTM1_9BURK|nr:acylneuraminate cytidylyltransferase family protein [Corticimicrobacter populi]PWF21226.1 acylneuraminate cytidylyltransferase [Corticimicrobacter populi]